MPVNPYESPKEVSEPGLNQSQQHALRDSFRPLAALHAYSRRLEAKTHLTQSYLVSQFGGR